MAFLSSCHGDDEPATLRDDFTVYDCGGSPSAARNAVAVLGDSDSWTLVMDRAAHGNDMLGDHGGLSQSAQPDWNLVSFGRVEKVVDST